MVPGWSVWSRSGGKKNGDLPREYAQVDVTRNSDGTYDYIVCDIREANLAHAAIDARERAWEQISDLETYSGLDFTGTSHVYSDKAELVDWLQTLIDVAAGAVDAVLSDDVVNAIADTIDSILYGVDTVVPDPIAAPEEYVADAMELLGFEFARNSDNYLVVDRSSGLFGLMKDARTFPDEIRAFAQTLTDFFVNGIELNFDQAIEDLIDSIAGFLPDLVQSITARADLDLNLFDLTASATLELTQRTTFDPSQVKIEYTWGDQTIIANYGDAVQFTVPEDFSGDAPDVEARLIFDGAYTYEYLLTPNFDIDFEMFGFSILGELEHGGDIIFSDTLEYALIKTTDDIDPDDFLSSFDDALIEIDVRDIEAAMLALFDDLVGAPIRAALGDDSTVDDGTISLGIIRDVDLEEDLDGNTFTSVTISNGVTISMRPTVLTGDDEANLPEGGAQSETLYGGAGIDTLVGCDGDDWLYVDHAEDVMVEVAGGGTADKVMAAVSYVLADGVDVELLTTSNLAGTGAIDLTGNELAQTIKGNAGNNALSGMDGDDTFFASLGKDTLDGGDGDDKLRGGAGVDTLIGGNGDDWLYVDQAGDVVVESADGGTADRVVASVSYVLGAGVGVEKIDMGSRVGTAAINLTGNELAQSITGNAGNNALTGMEGNDILLGDDGDDTIGGGAGADRMTGGTGADAFVFSTAIVTGEADAITDFSVIDDGIFMSSAIFAALDDGGLDASAFDVNLKGNATSAATRVIYETDTGRLFYDADGKGGASGLRFAMLDSNLALTAADFMVI